jgi:hypothetical protein
MFISTRCPVTHLHNTITYPSDLESVLHITVLSVKTLFVYFDFTPLLGKRQGFLEDLICLPDITYSQHVDKRRSKNHRA